MAKSDFYRREIIKRKPNVLEEIKTLLVSKFGVEKAEKLFKYITKNCIFLVLKAYVISQLKNIIEY